MLAIEIEFLTGRFAASAHDDRARPEWPPHPARLFSALVATWADADEPSPEERTAMTRLEEFGDPDIVASRCSRRTVVTHFVPINDTAVIRTHVDRMSRVVETMRALADGPSPKEATKLTKQLDKERAVDAFVAADGKGNMVSALQLFPEQRPKQARTFPSVSPEDPVVTYQWPDAVMSAEEREALDRVLVRVSRIGHSSSFVACRLADALKTPTLVPDKAGKELLRSVRPGQVSALEQVFKRHQGSGPRTLPATGVRYSSTAISVPPVEELIPTTAGEWQILEFLPESRRRPMTTSVVVARAIRGAMLAHAAEPHAELLSGHVADGAPTRRPHVAVVPLPFVGHARATGALMGVAVILPSDVPMDDVGRAAIFDALARWESAGLELRLGSAGVMRLKLTDEPTVTSLRRDGWVQASRRWTSATPVALSQHPGSLRRGSAAKQAAAWNRAEGLVRRECEYVGLPAPATVRVDLAPMLAGSAAAPMFPAFVQYDHRSRCDAARALVHVELRFEEPVRGPLLLGAGRYLGLGLMRPMGTSDE